MLNNKRILIAAGGTGGHVNPALAVAGEIRNRCPNAEILFVGTSDRIEAKIVPAAGFDLKTIDISGFNRNISFSSLKHNVKTVQQLLKSTSSVKKIISDFKPDVAIGFGGYVSGPVIRTAVKMGIPSAIHEQNAYPGVTNKTLAKVVDRVLLTVADAEKYLKSKNPVAVTGLPVRGEIALANREISRAELKLDEKPMILSMGGSLGARTINEAMVELITRVHKQNKYNFVHAMGQYGLWVPDKLKEKGVSLEQNKNIIIREYIDDMDICMAACDLVICRAGASSLSEIQVMGKASILIPSPNVAENHQYHNAMALVRSGAALIIEEKDLNGDTLYNKVIEISDNPSVLKSLGENARKMAITDSKERIFNVLAEIAK